jgi:hypothetical protein
VWHLSAHQAMSVTRIDNSYRRCIRLLIRPRSGTEVTTHNQPLLPSSLHSHVPCLIPLMTHRHHPQSKHSLLDIKQLSLTYVSLRILRLTRIKVVLPSHRTKSDGGMCLEKEDQTCFGQDRAGMEMTDLLCYVI